MNRPKKDNYVYCSGAIFDSTKYEDDLETYCDALEEMLRFYKRALNSRYGLSATPEESGMEFPRYE